MKSTAISVTLTGFILILSAVSINAWVHFNRYSRNLLPNLGYGNGGLSDAGGGGGGAVGGVGYQPVQNEVYGIVESVMEDEPCYARKCTSNDHCCQGSVCVNIDGEIGNCLFIYGRKIGDLCHRNGDCETGLTCDKGPNGNGNTVCRAPMAPVAKQFGDDCDTSTECDMARGLCCQLQRHHHRRVPKKVCSYFKDPMMCIDVIPLDEEPKTPEKGLPTSFKHRGLN